MRRYLSAHIAEEKRAQAAHAPFRRKFYAAGCYWDKRAGQLEHFESEKVVSISSSDTKAEVTTSRLFSEKSETCYLLRYHLQAKGDDWLIADVHTQCCACTGEPGNKSCRTCHGTGWSSANERLSKRYRRKPSH